MNNYPNYESNKVNKKVIAVIQARMESVRLPGKAMLELAGKPLLAHVIERTLAIAGIDRVVLATGNGAENMQLVELAKSMDIDFFIGSPENVLERYYYTAHAYGGDYIVRVTGDNPFTDPDYASMVVDIALESGADLCAIPNLPLGAAVEVIKREALNEAFEMSEKQYHFEHVTPFIKEHSELFHIERHPVHIANPFKNLRLTVDTPEDYKLAKIIFEKLYEGRPFSLESVINFLTINPELVNINNSVVQRPMTHTNNG